MGAVDRARLPDVALPAQLCTFGFRPSRTLLVDAGSSAGYPKKSL